MGDWVVGIGYRRRRGAPTKSKPLWKSFQSKVQYEKVMYCIVLYYSYGAWISFCFRLRPLTERASASIPHTNTSTIQYCSTSHLSISISQEQQARG